MIHGDDEILIACSFWWGVLIVSFWWGNCCSCKSFAKVGLLELCPAQFFFSLLSTCATELPKTSSCG